MLEDPNKREAFFHTALVYQNVVKIGSESADAHLRELLERYITFEGIYKEHAMNTNEYRSNAKDVGLDKLLKKIESIGFNFHIFNINDEDFPERLKCVPRATPVLYVRGEPEIFEYKSIAVVGTRQLNSWTHRKDGERVINRLLEKDYVIVSGLAKGCDTLAHETAVGDGSETIAVLGTPLDRYYPKENRKLQDKIASSHLLVSQYPFFTRTFPSHFAHRNKTTVALSSEGVVVIRAGDRSGTQHAIRHCLAQEKQLYVLQNNLAERYKWTEKYKGQYKVCDSR